MNVPTPIVFLNVLYGCETESLILKKHDSTWKQSAE